LDEKGNTSMTIPEIKKRITRVLKKYGAKRASPFGSIVRQRNVLTTEVGKVLDIYRLNHGRR